VVIVATEETSEKLLALVDTIATTALSLPPDEREAWLKRNRENRYNEALSANASTAEANEWADKVDYWVRSLIDIIRNSGGEAGGSA
jgi:hypothetical protein